MPQTISASKLSSAAAIPSGPPTWGVIPEIQRQQANDDSVQQQQTEGKAAVTPRMTPEIGVGLRLMVQTAPGDAEHSGGRGGQQQSGQRDGEDSAQDRRRAEIHRSPDLKSNKKRQRPRGTDADGQAEPIPDLAESRFQRVAQSERGRRVRRLEW